MLFSSLHLKGMIHWAVLARFSCAVLRITAEIARKRKSEELQNRTSLITSSNRNSWQAPTSAIRYTMQGKPLLVAVGYFTMTQTYCPQGFVSSCL